MTTSRRNKLAAIAVFALLAGVMCGGIAWATVASLELTKNSYLAEHDRHVREAVSKLDGYVNGVINTETAREYKEYRSQYLAEAVAVQSREGIELDANVLLPSPLATRAPAQDWVDLYFQVNPDGVASSPQVPMEGTLHLPSRARMAMGCDPNVCKTWAWFTTKALPLIDFERIGSEDEEEEEDGPVAELDQGTTARRLSRTQYRNLAKQLGERLAASEYQKRKKSYQRSQVGHLPPHECVPQHIAEANILDPGQPRVHAVMSVSYYAPDVEVRTGRFVEPFWLEPEPEGGPKLAFVRRVYRDDDVFYQGFIADWNRLRTTLIDQVEDLFPEADVRATSPSVKSDTKLVNLPVELVVPDATAEASAAAWASIGGTLFATWLVAVGVLVVAGIGLRNLVALTERRMRFAYAVTHELRTPLTTFRLYTDMLTAGLVPDQSRQEYLETLNSESKRLSDLVEDVLEFARLENHKVKLKQVDTDAPSLLAMIAETHAKRCAASGLQPVTESTMTNGQALRADVDVVNRIAGVLINNACRHAGGLEGGTVLLRLGAENGHVHLDVIDSGPGVERGDAHQIFKPFRRGRGVDKQAHGGVGLGLSLARSWAQMLGGRLDLVARQDEQYGGAHFRLTFPAKAPSNN